MYVRLDFSIGTDVRNFIAIFLPPAGLHRKFTLVSRQPSWSSFLVCLVVHFANWLAYLDSNNESTLDTTKHY